MDLREITITNFVLLEDKWTRTNCLALLEHLQPSYAIISIERGSDQYYLIEALDLFQLLIDIPQIFSLADALDRTTYMPIPALESDSEAEDAPDQCIVLEDGYPIGFFDTSIPPASETLRSGTKNTWATDESEFELSSLIVDVPENVSLNGVVSVLVSLSAESIVEAESMLPLNLPSGVAVDVIVRARRGLVFEGETEGQLVIPDEGETLPLQFRLRGVESGLGKFKLFAFHNRQSLGVLHLGIQVLNASETPGVSQHSALHPLQPLDAYYPGLSQITLERKLAGKREITPPLNVQNSQQNGSTPPTANATALHPQVLWQDCKPEQLIEGLQLGQRSIKTNAQLKKVLAEELEALLAHLLSGTEMILVTTLTPGFSGAKVLKVKPFAIGSGEGGLFVVKFGEIRAIEQEYANYQKYVFFYNGSGRYTAAFRHEQTANLGGVLYAFAGTDIRSTHDFGSIYQQWEFPQIKAVLDNLFCCTCRNWYANTKPLYLLNLTEAYQQQGSDSPKKLERIVMEHLPTVQFQQMLTFSSFKTTPEHSFSNPFRVPGVTDTFIRSTYVSTTHGDLNQRNILVDHIGYPWLIDFQSTGPSHILRDVATLDVVTRFQLLLTHQATLDEFLTLEEALYTAQFFSQLDDLPDIPLLDNPALVKVYQTVLHLRKLARWMIRDQEKDMSEYYIALLYITLDTLQYFKLSIEQRERALLSASLLVNILGLTREQASFV